MQVVLAPEVLFTIAGIQITNSVFTSFVVFVLITIFSLLIVRKLSVAKPTRFQIVVESLVNGLCEMVGEADNKKRSRSIFGFAFTFFVFILISNWFGLFSLAIPLGVEHKEDEYTIVDEEEAHEVVTPTESEEEEHGEEIKDTAYVPEENDEHAKSAGEAESKKEELSITSCLISKHCYLTLDGIKEFHGTTHIFRPATTDLSGTLALAIVSVFMTNVIGLWILRLGYVKKFIHILEFPKLVKAIVKAFRSLKLKSAIGSTLMLIMEFVIKTFVGLLEIVSEFGKLLSFSFRLFGNIFAGEVLLLIITSLTFGVFTLPFLGLEIFVGFIQAFVFFILTASFIGLAIKPHDDHH